MKTYNSKRGLFIGAFIFAFLVFAVGVGMWVFAQNTDNRSQASASPVAEVRVISQKAETKSLAHHVLIDISQMKKGTTVSEFSTQVFVTKKLFGPPDQTTSPRPKPTLYPQPSSTNAIPNVQMVTTAPLQGKNVQVLGVSTSEAVPLDFAKMPPPDAAIDPNPNEPAPNAPLSNIVAQSMDGVLRVQGLGEFSKLQNLQVTVETFEKGYLITFSAQAPTKILELQQAFRQPQALFSILATETRAAILAPTVENASIKGYLPGMKTVVELTTPMMAKPTSFPTDKPPMVVSKCRTSRDCPKGYTCTQPKTPICPPGKVCKTLMADWQCTLMPTPTVKKLPSKIRPTMPPMKITGRQEINIKFVE